ncbi:hypothetical protein LRM47_00745 [Candidatus Nanosynbacter sp. TM7-076]|jgi:hypothetical protein|uniref:hypothetical protein n=1 Tax=Candidatus Nanosynbacter sp. TM7-076 TaxID=2902629 RepID=UPI001FB74FD5|nr:hypothetical protein [Candidatus Nanosynbacter sp. TM7-076]MCJ1967567.1 hypothetical protein [Candidatus Nanosynbacter sp. TM7-076]DAS27813.1 MAG TPA: hypothetical protein [Caudoviricetes sp.]
MYIPIITFPQSVARSVLKNFVRDIIAFDEKPRSNRAKIECIDWYCELLSLLIEEEQLNAVAGQLSIILETTDDKHLRKALKDSVKHNADARKALYKKQCAFKRKNKEKNNDTR